MTPEQFGSYIRQEREARGISLRKFAKMLDISPTYLSKVERDEEKPSAAMVIRIAEVLQLNKDELLGKAGKIAPDVMEIILSDPRLWAGTIRTIARQRERLNKRIAGRRPADFSDCGVPHLAG